MYRSVIALVFLTSVAITGVAHAQERTYRIPISDLDLSTGKDKARFDQRVEAVARQMCETRSSTSNAFDRNYQECQRAVREEANENLQIALRKNATQMAVQTPRR